MANKLFQSVKNIAVFVFIFMLFALATTGVSAQQIGNQLTVLYETEDHDFSDINIDRERISSVERVSDLIDIVHLNDSNDASDMIREIERNDKVKAVDFQAVAQTEMVPNDKHYGQYQAYLKDLGYENVVAGENQVKVAVVDTGVDPNHVDLIGRVEQSGYNYIDNNQDTTDMEGHGTFVAGIISAITNNEIGIAGATGTADVVIVPYLTLDENGEGKLSDIAAAFEDIAKRDDIKVVNLSLGFDGENDVLEKACQSLVDSGKILVASSGNAGDDVLMYPAGYSTTLSVGAVNSNLQRCTEADWGEGNGSNYGEGLDVVAPGNEIISLLNEGDAYTLGSGTSYSAPFVSAACALAATKQPSVNFEQAKAVLATTSLDLNTPGYDVETGNGLLQMDAFVDQFGGNAPILTDPDTQEMVYRLYNAGNNEHLYTSNAYEAEVLAATGWNDEGTAWIAPKEGQPVYRLYNPTTNEHLYTVDVNEVNALKTTGWTVDNNEEPLFYSDGDKPIYRLYHEGTQRHLLTTDQNEFDTLGAADWNQEGIALYAIN